MKDIISHVFDVFIDQPKFTPIDEIGRPLYKNHILVSADLEDKPLDLNSEDIILNSYNGSIHLGTTPTGTQKLRVTAKLP